MERCLQAWACLALVSYGPAQPIPVLAAYVKLIIYDLTEILKSDSARLGLFPSLHA